LIAAQNWRAMPERAGGAPYSLMIGHFSRYVKKVLIEKHKTLYTDGLIQPIQIVTMGTSQVYYGRYKATIVPMLVGKIWRDSG
jgi:hypothetical protein